MHNLQHIQLSLILFMRYLWEGWQSFVKLRSVLFVIEVVIIKVAMWWSPCILL